MRLGTFLFMVTLALGGCGGVEDVGSEEAAVSVGEVEATASSQGVAGLGQLCYRVVPPLNKRCAPHLYCHHYVDTGVCEKAPLAKEGELCFSIVGGSRECEPGLVCTRNGVDTATCQRPAAKEGEICFSIIGGSRPCAPGLTCKRTGVDVATCQR